MVENDWRLADLVGKDMSATQQDGVHAKGANLAMICLADSIFTASNFVNAGFWKANLTNSSFSGCNFSGANFAEAKLNNAVFTDCDFTMADLSAADLTQATFIRCSLVGVNLSQAICEKLHVEAVNMWGVLGMTTSAETTSSESVVKHI